MSCRPALAGPIDQVIPGLTSLAKTLNSPVLTTLPTDLGEFLKVINDLSRRMSPLSQIAEQAGGLFGLRIPGLPARPATLAATPAATVAPSPPAAATATPAKKAPAKKRAAKKRAAKKTPAKKKASAAQG